MPLIVCGVFVAELALTLHRRYDKSQAWLLLWALVAMVLYGCHFLFFHHSTSWVALTDSVYSACNLAVYPLYLLYISELTDRCPLSAQRRRLCAMMLPAAVGGILVAVLYALMDSVSTDAFVESYLYENSRQGLHGVALAQAWTHDACHLVFAASVVAVMVGGVRRVRRYNRTVDELFADTEGRSLHHIDLILRLLVLTSLLSVFVNGVGRFWFADSPWLTLPSLAFSALLFAIGWTGLQPRMTIAQMDMQPKSTQSMPQTATPAAAPTLESQSEPTAAATTSQLYTRLEELMSQQLVFLQQDLRLDLVAQMLGTNRTYLLQTLRAETGMTFREYVNRQRIRYAEELMRKSPELSKTDVATLSGYSTPSSFYRNLKVYGSQAS